MPPALGTSPLPLKRCKPHTQTILLPEFCLGDATVVGFAHTKTLQQNQGVLSFGKLLGVLKTPSRKYKHKTTQSFEK